jgi:RNAse (barnase) inhibitor barstar
MGEISSIGRDELFDLYTTQKLPVKVILKHFQISENTMRRRLSDYLDTAATVVADCLTFLEVFGGQRG